MEKGGEGRLRWTSKGEVAGKKVEKGEWKLRWRSKGGAGGDLCQEILWWSPVQEWRMGGEKDQVNSMRMVKGEKLERNEAEHKARKS